MKKVLLAISLITILTSCEGGDKVVISKEEYNQLVNKPNPKQIQIVGYDNLKAISGGNCSILLGSDQHEYMVVNRGCNSETIVHYIDCELCATRKQQEFDLLVKTLKDTTNVRN